MTEKKQETENGAAEETQAISIEEAKTVSFQHSDTLVGQMLDGRFLIEKDLTDGGADKGGIGLVYLAKDMKLMGKETVVKILQKEALENTDLIRKFEHEKEALIRIEHPNIVRILDSGTLSDGNPFMVMEYIAGYSLRRKMRDGGRLDFQSAANIIESVTSALSVAHAEKVLHRDIKPENIMLTPQEGGAERVRLIDFGIARVEDAELAPVTTVPRGIGTILYIAPEQLAGKLEQTPAVDIYSFAIVVYEMLTGELPFKPKNVIEMFEAQKEGVKISPRELREDLPEAAAAILLSALAFYPEQRPRNARAFGRELANALRESPVTGEIKSESLDTFAHSVKSSPNAVAEPTEPVNSTKDNNFATPSDQMPGGNSKKAILGIAVGGLILATVVGFLAFGFWKGNNQNVAEVIPNKTSVDSTNSAGTINAPTKELTYFLNVQKMRDEKPYGEPFQATGQEIYESGYKFKININSNSKGFLYLFNEGKDDKGAIVYNILFPTPKRNNGSAEIEKNGSAETAMNTFEGGKGTENVWMIWAAQPNDDLNSVKQNAFDNQGIVTDVAAQQKLIDFVQKYGGKQPEKITDKPNARTTLKSADETFAYKLELQHQ